MKTPTTDRWRYRREPRPFHPDEVGLNALAAGIVQQAVEDYREAEKKLKNVPPFEREGDRDRYIITCKKSKHEIVKFLKSEWYGVLCDIDPERILRKLGAI
jgi:hypothetical protein